MRSFSLPIFVFLTLSAVSAQTFTSRTYGGSGSDAVNGITTDSAGNIYVVGTTTSVDLPLLNPAQSANTGTQLLFSPDDGLTWKPLGNLPGAYLRYQYSQSMPLAVDPTNAAVFYVGFNVMIFKTTDSGQHFLPGVALPQAGQINSIVIDPSNPLNIYAGTIAGVFKSADGGLTWISASAGFPAQQDVGIFAIDPFHPQSLWAPVGNLAFMSKDGANSWTQVSLPPPASSGSLIQFLFDPLTPGTLYLEGVQNDNSAVFLVKSQDGGQTWSQLKAPFEEGLLVADPVRAGYLYTLSPGVSQGLFYRSADGGASWQSFPFPALFASSVAINPHNPNVIIAGSYRSTDNGQTWMPTPVSRDIQMAFAPTGKGLVFATGPLTSDIFLAKFSPDAKTLEFATYFGGMGTETAAGVQVDTSGNVWVAGNTNSLDLPVSNHAFQRQLKGASNILLAEFSPQGKLITSTYLGGSFSDSVNAIKLDPKGTPWIFGQTDSADFPLTKGGPPNVEAGEGYLFLAKISPSASEVLFSAAIPNVNQPGGMSIDSDGNIVLTGASYSSDFSVTPGVVHGSLAPNTSTGQAVLIKLDGSGNTVFSTYLGGATASPVRNGIELENVGVAVATDSTGVYITGNTSAIDFPTTSGAYQTKLKAGCQYPAMADDTGFIGTIVFYAVDDVFVTKLTPDAKKVLYSTLLGGSCYDRPTDIAVAPDGAVFVAGETDSIDFPTEHPFETAPAIQDYKSFVAMLSPSGNALPYSSYLSAGSAPTLALAPSGILQIAGASGFGAQTQTFSGFPNPPISPLTEAYLGSLNPSGASAALNLTDALNAFSLMPGAVAPGEIIQLTLPGFIPSQTLTVGLNELLPLGTSLGGVEVLFDGKPAPVISVLRGRILCIAPQDFGNSQTSTIQVNANGKLSNPLTVSIMPTALGLLSADGSGTGLANARNSDGTLNSPTHPAERGTTVIVYFTGAGVPPVPIAVNIADGSVASATVSPLHGFVPGIYAAYFQAPTNPAITSPLSIYLFTTGSTLSSYSTSQTLTLYIE